jgi:hypothetical protein
MRKAHDNKGLDSTAMEVARELLGGRLSWHDFISDNKIEMFSEPMGHYGLISISETSILKLDANIRVPNYLFDDGAISVEKVDCREMEVIGFDDYYYDYKLLIKELRKLFGGKIGDINIYTFNPDGLLLAYKHKYACHRTDNVIAFAIGRLDIDD